MVTGAAAASAAAAEIEAATLSGPVGAGPTGSLTATMEALWGLGGVGRTVSGALHLHHCLDTHLIALPVACADGPLIVVVPVGPARLMKMVLVEANDVDADELDELDDPDDSKLNETEDEDDVEDELEDDAVELLFSLVG